MIMNEIISKLNIEQSTTENFIKYTFIYNIITAV